MPQQMVQSMHDNYVQRLDLGDDPFRADFRSPFFYPGGDRQKVLEQLIHYGRFSAQPIALIGEEGSGKSHLLEKLIEEFGATIDVRLINTHQIGEQTPLLAVIAQQFSIALDHQQSIKSFVEGIRFTLSGDDELDPFLLIIDNADSLLAQELESLFMLSEQLAGAMHLVFVLTQLNPVIETVLQQTKIVIKQIELIPLSRKEVAEFIESSLLSVGFAGEFPLSQHQISEISDSSLGSFTKIKQQASELLGCQSKQKISDSRSNIPIAHILAIAILASAMTVAYLYEGSVAELPVRALAHKQDQSVVAIDKKADEKPEKKAEIKPEIQSERKVELLKTQESEQITLPSLNIKAAAIVREESKVLPFTTQAKKLVTDKALHNRVLVAAPDDARVADTRESKLLAMPATVYMLQLIGVSNEQSAKRFIKQYSSQLPLTYFQTVLKGNPWYVVLAGPYNGRKEAIQAKAFLPKALSKQSWVRSIADIQADMRKSPQFLIKESIKN